jgi:hypothetical protein
LVNATSVARNPAQATGTNHVSFTASLPWR